MHRILGRLGISITTLIVAVLLLELGLRLFTPAAPGLILHDPTVGARHLRSFAGEIYNDEVRRKVGVSFNRDGFRGPDRPYPKPPGTRRIAVLGDSMVAALEVEEQETFVRRLEELLARSRPAANWEVHNFGVAGSSLDQQWALHREVVALYEPDLVIGCFFAGNDMGDLMLRLPADEPARIEVGPAGELVQREKRRERSALSLWLNRHSRAYVWQKKLLRPLRHAANPPDERLHGSWINSTKLHEPLAHAWSWSETLIGALRDEVAASGGVYALALIPGAEHIYPAVFRELPPFATGEAEHFDPDHAEREVAAMCERLGVPFVSSVPPLRAAANGPAPGPPETWLFQNGWQHLHARGHRIVAQTLHDFLMRDEGEGPLLGRAD